MELVLWGPIFILEALKITAGKFIVCYGKVKHYLRRHIQTYIYIYMYVCILIKTEADVGKGKENLSIIVILSHILALGYQTLGYLLSTGLEMKRDWAIVQLQNQLYIFLNKCTLVHIKKISNTYLNYLDSLLILFGS